MKICLLLIDPQNDFCSKQGSLYVQGAEDDSMRLSSFISRNSQKIDTILVTMDNHPSFHIAHPVFWKTKENTHPAPFTVITHKDIEKGLYSPSVREFEAAAENYLLALETKGRYNHTIWPPHCLIGTWGSCVEKNVMNSLYEWEMNHIGKNVEFIHKSSNSLTEHYSAVQAEVPDPSDQTTRPNFHLIDTLKTADRVIAAGEALSHCVANTLRDICVYVPAKKITLLNDCSSNVQGYAYKGDEFYNEFIQKGMQFCNADSLVL